MGDVSGEKCSMNDHTVSQHDCDSNNGDVSSVNGFINIHTNFQCDDSSDFKGFDGYVFIWK